MRKKIALISILVIIAVTSYSQIDSTLIYNAAAPFGALDLRISKNPTSYYFIKENTTFSYRTTGGTPSNSFYDMTPWDSRAYKEGYMSERQTERERFVMNYRILFPENYDKQFSEGYPLVIVLHGMHERGNCALTDCYHATTGWSPEVNQPPAPSSPDSKLLNNDYNLIHAGHPYLEAVKLAGQKLPNDAEVPARAFPGIVVFPQNLNGWDSYSVEDAIRLVRLLTKKYNVNRSQIYINGISNGGRGAYEALKRAPWLFAAAVLFSAADDSNLLAQNLQSSIASVPIWVFQGGVDKQPTPRQTERYVRAMRDAGATIRYTLYPQLAHGTWNKAIAEPDFFSWMLGKRKNDIQIFSGNAVICNTTGQGAKLSLPFGYKVYEWELGGKVIESEKTFQINAATPGTYRARFLVNENLGQWSPWSTPVVVIEKNLNAPTLIQIGSSYLRDLNGNNKVTLHSASKFEHYYWYKDNTPIDLPGNGDDTTRTVTLSSTSGDGSYTLRVSDFDKCLSPPSAATVVTFDNRSQLSIAAPSGVTLQAVSPARVKVSWNNSGENKYATELWRRNKSANSSWEMVAIALPSQSTRDDEPLTPSTEYEYRLRHIGSNQRSDYSVSVSTTTEQDISPPSAPATLSGSLISVDKVRLNWSPSKDNSSIKRYVIFANSDSLTISADTVAVVGDLELNKDFIFQVKAVDAGGNFSNPSNEKMISTFSQGLFYQHSTGAWQTIAEIDWSIVEAEGIVNEFTLQPKTQDDFFNFRFEGFLYIKKAGVYQMRLTSDDGSQLYLNDTLIVSNDGIHKLTTTTGPIQLLGEGPHHIEVEYFDFMDSDTLAVEYKGPDSDGQWARIPKEALSSNLVTSLENETRQTPFIHVYPNPSSDGKITITFDLSAFPCELSIIGSHGEQVNRSAIEERDISHEGLALDVSYLPPGLYTAIVRTKERTSVTRFILNK